MSNHKTQLTKATTDRRQCYGDNNMEREHAPRFRGRFAGAHPAPRPEERAWLSDLLAEEGLRNGRCINCAD